MPTNERVVSRYNYRLTTNTLTTATSLQPAAVNRVAPQTLSDAPPLCDCNTVSLLNDKRRFDPAHGSTQRVASTKSSTNDAQKQKMNATSLYSSQASAGNWAIGVLQSYWS